METETTRQELEERVKKLEHENDVLKYVVYRNCFKPDFYFSIDSRYDNEMIGEFRQIMEEYKKGIRG